MRASSLEKLSIVRGYIRDDWDRNFFDLTDNFCRLYYTIQDLSNYKIVEN